MIIWKKVNSKYIFKKKIAFNSSKWVSIIKKRLNNNFKNSNKKNYLNQFLASSPLPLMILNDNKKKINIVDFGSGSQELFFSLSQIKLNKKINIDSIEVDYLVDIFKKKKFNINNIEIKFFKEFNFRKKYDYIHISDSLQYILNWKNFLIKINLSNSKFVILNSLNSGDIKTYLTKQKFYNSELPNIFFSSNQIISIMKNYDLIYKSYFLSKINDKYGELPQLNFKKKDRIKYPKTFIFKKKKFISNNY